MSKLVIFSIRDTVAEVFNKPFTDLNVPSGIRAFTQSLEEAPNKTDYVLYKIGEMDQINGEITPEKEPVKLFSGFDLTPREVN